MTEQRRYYLDTSPAYEPAGSRTIYDEQDGMPVLTVEPQGGVWTPERQGLLEAILATINSPAVS